MCHRLFCCHHWPPPSSWSWASLVHVACSCVVVGVVVMRVAGRVGCFESVSYKLLSTESQFAPSCAVVSQVARSFMRGCRFTSKISQHRPLRKRRRLETSPVALLSRPPATAASQCSTRPLIAELRSTQVSRKHLITQHVDEVMGNIVVCMLISEVLVLVSVARSRSS